MCDAIIAGREESFPAHGSPSSNDRGRRRHGTATPTYLAAPRRNRVMIAKVAAAGLVGLVFGAVAAGVATAIGLAFVAAKGFGVAVPTAALLRYAAGAAAGSALLAAAGTAVGPWSLSRSSRRSASSPGDW
jgi:hypothetical protein